jgi:hypothetical protein
VIPRHNNTIYPSLFVESKRREGGTVRLNYPPVQ